MKDKTLFFSLFHSPNAKLKSLALHFILATIFFKVIQDGWETLQYAN